MQCLTAGSGPALFLDRRPAPAIQQKVSNTGLNLLFLSYFYPASEEEIEQNICPLIATPRQYFWAFWLPLLSLLYLGVRWLIPNQVCSLSLQMFNYNEFQRPTTTTEVNIIVLAGSLPMCFLLTYYGVCKLIYVMFSNLEEEILNSCFNDVMQLAVLLWIICIFYTCVCICLEYLKK